MIGRNEFPARLILLYCSNTNQLPTGLGNLFLLFPSFFQERFLSGELSLCRFGRRKIFLQHGAGGGQRFVCYGGRAGLAQLGDGFLQVLLLKTTHFDWLKNCARFGYRIMCSTVLFQMCLLFSFFSSLYSTSLSLSSLYSTSHPEQLVRLTDQLHLSQRGRAPAWIKPRNSWTFKPMTLDLKIIQMWNLYLRIWELFCRGTPTKRASTGWRSTSRPTRSPSSTTPSSKNYRASALTGGSTTLLLPLSVFFLKVYLCCIFLLFHLIQIIYLVVNS